jgi:crotonobetainyl-CoA:carnitine CoA-transferase CaiB-like acyl-CoA transferase
LDKLIGECDVFINGYRGGAIDRLGYGKQAVLDIIKKARGKDASVVYVDENTYGTEGGFRESSCGGQLPHSFLFPPTGPYRERPGWQQIADSASGACMVMGRGIGKNEVSLTSN